MADRAHQVFTLPAGTVVKVNGIPLTLVSDTQIECAEANYRLLASQDWQVPVNPAQAAALPVMSTTNTSSLASMRAHSQSRT